MKRISLSLIAFMLVFTTSIFYACKGKDKAPVDTPSTTTTMDTTTPMAMPSTVDVSSNDVLQKGLNDALKDHPGVKGEVSDSVINLSGEIKRADWQKLNPTLNSLHPKRINSNNLTIK